MPEENRSADSRPDSYRLRESDSVDAVVQDRRHIGLEPSPFRGPSRLQIRASERETQHIPDVRHAPRRCSGVIVRSLLEVKTGVDRLFFCPSGKGDDDRHRARSAQGLRAADRRSQSKARRAKLGSLFTVRSAAELDSVDTAGGPVDVRGIPFRGARGRRRRGASRCRRRRDFAQRRLPPLVCHRAGRWDRPRTVL